MKQIAGMKQRRPILHLVGACLEPRSCARTRNLPLAKAKRGGLRTYA